MYIDQKTLQDLSIFHKSGGVYHLINQCTTLGGATWLKKYMAQPPAEYNKLLQVQSAIRYWSRHYEEWCGNINNGTMLMVDKFYSSSETIINKPTVMSLMVDKIVRYIIPNNEQSLLKFSITQVMEFVKGCHYLTVQHLNGDTPEYLKEILVEMKSMLEAELPARLIATSLEAPFKVLMTLSYYTRKHLKNTMAHLVHLFEKMDALRGMAIAGLKKGWVFPELLPEAPSVFQANGLYHPLLENPVAYDVSFSREKNFMFLTGANMSGKSTLIRSMGICAYLAHLGLAVPARQARISFLHGIITNMQIEDNIYKGESYFYAEVQRIKNTAIQISETQYNLVLMDELFKGTNVHDAYECTQAVIQSLVQSKTDIMALSTHLYEIGGRFASVPNIQFRYCETLLKEDGTFVFTYQLKEGVSNDRIGYLVLKNEGVLDILEKLK